MDTLEFDGNSRGHKNQISRRTFIGTTLGGSAALLAGGLSSLITRSTSAATGSWIEATIPQLQALMNSGALTSAQLVTNYLNQIASLNPLLHAVIETNPDALSIAQARDKERKTGKLRGPLHGIPIIVKDNLATKDKMQTTAGSLALVGSTVPADSVVVNRLRTAGAVILGKANLSEWANFRGNAPFNGWSARGGFTRDPYLLSFDPCGSSSGSAVAAAANMCAATVGTETDGSVVCPSGNNLNFGLKPTVGLVSQDGIIPIAHSQDTAGPMAHTVTDAAILLGTLTGVDARDEATAASTGRSRTEYTSVLDPAGLKGARLGVCRSRFMGYSAATDALMEGVIDALKRLGAVIVDPADIATAGQFDESEYAVLLYEFKADLNKYLGEWAPGAGAKTLADLIAFNERAKDKEMPYFGQEIFIQAQAKGPLTDQDYLRALDKNHLLARTQGIDTVMAEHQLDALIAPTGGPASLIDLVNGDPGGGGSFSSPAAVAGYPHVTVPMGQVRGLPVGLSFVGRPWTESVLIRLAFAYEQATQARRPPRFAPSAALSGGAA